MERLRNAAAVSTFSDGHGQSKTLVGRTAPPVPPTKYLITKTFSPKSAIQPQLVPQGETESERIDTGKMS
jgi:hypothetical protein